MQYIIKDINDEEHGPVDVETLAKWVDEDRITAETPVRSTLMANWRTADQMKFLKERLEEQAVRKQKAATMVEKSGSVLKSVKGRLAEKFVPKVTSGFEQKRAPLYAAMVPRLMAGLYDFFLILIAAAIIYSIGIAYAYQYPGSETDDSREEIAEKDDMMLVFNRDAKVRMAEIERRFEAAKRLKEGEELEKIEKSFKEEIEAEKVEIKKFRAEVHQNNLDADCPPYTVADRKAGYQISSLWFDNTSEEEYVCLSGKPGAARWVKTSSLNKILTTCIIVLVLSSFIFNAFCLAYYSQTLGMWYWGIFLTKSRISEVFFMRSFIFTLLYPVCFIFSPLFVYVFHRGLHEILSGTRLIRVFSNRNA